VISRLGGSLALHKNRKTIQGRLKFDRIMLIP